MAESRHRARELLIRFTMTESLHRIVFFAYDCLWRAALPLLRRNQRLAAGFSQRCLRQPLPRADLWIQAASVGEAQLAWQIIGRLRPPAPVRALVTTNTRQGLDVLRQAAGRHPAPPGVRLSGLAYFPFDRPAIMRRAVDSVRPRVVVLLESEIWPGLLAQLKARGGRCLIVNGRMTPRSLRRYRIWPSIWRALRPERVLAVSPADGARFAALFGPAGIEVLPNLKFDRMRVGAAPPRSASGGPAAITAQGPLVVLGSIRRAEEAQVLRIIRRLRQTAPEAVIGLFPRHAHRLAAWQKRLRGASIPWVQRSTIRAPVSPGSVILWDGFGELAAAYGGCRAAFVGGSLAPLGGQNFLEALNGGVRPVIGPHWANFAWVGRDLLNAGLVHEVADWRAAADALVTHLHHPMPRRQIRERAAAYIRARQGATARAAGVVCDLLLAPNLPGRRATPVHPFKKRSPHA
jgi:3-deoxy-D-manno-octulosonic-acid transferase